MAIVAGFLLSAVQTWTGRPGLHGRSLLLLGIVWLLARLAWLSDLPLPLLSILELAFPLALAVVMARMLWLVRQKRNYPLVAVLLLLAAVDGLSLVGLANADEMLQRQAVLAGVWPGSGWWRR